MKDAPPITFDLMRRCRVKASSAVDFLEAVLEKSQESLKDGYDPQLLNLGFKAASMILAYGYGSPTSKFELTGRDGGPIETTSIDPTKLSTKTLSEILEARRGAKKPE